MIGIAGWCRGSGIGQLALTSQGFSHRTSLLGLTNAKKPVITTVVNRQRYPAGAGLWDWTAGYDIAVFFPPSPTARPDECQKSL
ncbi:hypothetical protein PoB_006091000 [Plakobranchus ocellatus]|uniref:Uncharacterized protein n=1 Tax=Plakobranchus ocellatus TaxID=259542 RepID=A0AAV4CRE3_9GAST|nr:hypothetical protein PoB_006091000 [Plakobranchus ocellatus]